MLWTLPESIQRFLLANSGVISRAVLQLPAAAPVALARRRTTAVIETARAHGQNDGIPLVTAWREP